MCPVTFTAAWRDNARARPLPERLGGASPIHRFFAVRRHSEGTMKSKQTGITLIGFLVVLMVVSFFGYMAMKLVPAYTEFMGVSKAMSQLATEDGPKSVTQVRNDLMKKLDFQYVSDDTITPQDITIKRTGNASQLNISYDKRIPFMYNIDFLLHFEKSVALQGNVEG
jgi:Tfp pilus assembly major pilin PilA